MDMAVSRSDEVNKIIALSNRIEVKLSMPKD